MAFQIPTAVEKTDAAGILSVTVGTILIILFDHPPEKVTLWVMHRAHDSW